MPSVTLSANTQNLIALALTSPGSGNVNYVNAYKAIYGDIAGSGLNPGTLNWFSQAGSVNGQLFSPSAAGTFIWNYTIAAAATAGYTLSLTALQTASNKIAFNVFQTLQKDGYVLSDTGPGGFSPQQIVQDDAGAGITYLQSLYPNLTYAAWGGTLFAQTELGDPTYVSDYKLNLTPGSSDCSAILAGEGSAFNAEIGYLATHPGSIGTAVGNSLSLDSSIINACVRYQPTIDGYNQFIPSIDAPSNGSGLSGFAVKYSDLTTALGLTSYAPTNIAAVTAAWTQVVSDFSGYYAVQSGDTWNSVSAKLGLSLSDLESLNNLSVMGSTAISSSAIVVPISTQAVVQNGSTLAIPSSADDDYEYDLPSNEYILAGTAFSDSAQGGLSIVDANGVTVNLGAGVANSLQLTTSGAVFNETGGTSQLYQANPSANVDEQIQTWSSANAGGSLEASFVDTPNGVDQVNLYANNQAETAAGGTLSLTGTTTTTVTDASGTYQILLAGTGDSATSLTGTNTLTDTGSGDTADLGSGALAAVGGSGDDLTLGIHGVVTFSGTSDVLDAVSGSVSLDSGSGVTIVGSLDLVALLGSGASVTASSDTLTLASGITASASGSLDIITASSADTLGLSGSGNALTATGDIVNLGASSSITVTGSSDVLGITTGGDSFTASRDTINIAAGLTTTGDAGTSDVVNLGSGDLFGVNASSDNFYGTGVTIDLGVSNQDDLQGNNDTVNFGSYDYIGLLGGSGTTINGSNGSMAAWAGTSFSLNGSDGVTLLGTGSTLHITGTSDTDGVTATDDTVTLGVGTALTVTGTGDVLGITKAGDSFAASGETVTIASGLTSSGDSGSNDIFTLGTADTLGLTGSANTVTATGDIVNLGASSSITVTGSGDTLSFSANGDYATGSGDKVNEVAGLTSAGITGNGDVINLTSSDAIGITGTGETVNASGDIVDVGANSGLTVTGSGDILSFSANGDYATGSGDTVDEVAGLTSAGITGNGDVINLTSSDAIGITGTGETVNASSDIVDVGANSGLTVTGSGDILSFSANGDYATGSGDTVDEVAGLTSAGITGNGDVINLTSSDAIGITGTSETVNASSDTVDVGANSGLTVNGGGDILSLSASGDSVTGSGDTIDVAANLGSATVSGNGNIFNLNSSSDLTLSGSSDTVDAENGDVINITGTGETVDGGSGDYVTMSGTSSATVTGNGETIALDSNSDGLTTTGSGDQINVYANDDSLTASSDSVSLSSNQTFTLSGAGDVLGGYNGDTMYVSGSGQTVNGVSGDVVALGAGTSATVNGNGETVDVNSGYDSVTANGIGDAIGVYANNALITGSQETVTDASNISFNLSGANDSISLDGSGDYVGLLVGDGSDTVYGSSDHIQVQNGVSGNIDGNNDTIEGGSGGYFNVDGSGDNVVLGNQTYIGLIGGDNSDVIWASGENIVMQSSVSVTIEGSNDKLIGSDDHVQIDGDNDAIFGNSNWADASSGDTGDFTDGTGDSDNGTEFLDDSGDDGPGLGYYGFVPGSTHNVLNGIHAVAQYDRAHGYTQAAAAAGTAMQEAVCSAAGLLPTSAAALPAVQTGPVWATPVVTWSFATGVTSGADALSGAIGADEQPVIEQAFAAWAAATGLTLQQVADPTTADISVGWSAFDTADSNILGYTTVQKSDGLLLPGAVVRLEDPGENALVSDASSPPTYSGTGATLYQDALHEIGHALGIQEDSDPNSVMYYELGSANQSLDSTDLAAAQAAYSGGAQSSEVMQLLHAMAAFTSDGGVAPPAANSNTEPAMAVLAASAVH